MSQRLNAAGRYKARIVSHGVTATKDKGLPQWVARFAAFEMEGVLQDENGAQIRDGAGRPKVGWVPLDDQYEIVEYLPLAFVKDGQKEFTNTFSNLQEALGWTPDPNDIFGSLQAMDLSNTTVQIVTEMEEYQGKTRCRVQFVNPVDFEGMGVRQLDTQALQKLQGDWASTFRAKFGGGSGAAAPAPVPAGARPTQNPATPAPAAPKPAAAPTPAPAAPAAPATATPAPAPAGGVAPKPPTKPQATQPPAPPTGDKPPAPMPGQAYVGGECSMDDAWLAFSAKRGKLSDDGLSKEWFRELADNFGAHSDDQITALTPAQWAWIRDHGEPLPF